MLSKIQLLSSSTIEKKQVLLMEYSDQDQIQVKIKAANSHFVMIHIK